jgi:hypothetical protein
MGSSYEKDVVAWANEQSALLRAGKFNLLDIEHIADEVEDVGKSEKRELESRLAVLMAHLLKWQFQPANRSKSWERTLRVQRKRAIQKLEETPSLTPLLSDPKWIDGAWGDAVTAAIKETGLDTFPETCPWSVGNLLDLDFLPS